MHYPAFFMEVKRFDVIEKSAGKEISMRPVIPHPLPCKVLCTKRLAG
jgi:hypothetical protein